MEFKLKIIKNIFIRFVLTFLGCLLVGFIFYEFQIFNTKNPPFDFVHLGLIAAIFFTLLQSISTRNALAVYVVLCIINPLLFQKSDEFYFSLFWNIIEIIILGIAIFLYWRFVYTKKVPSGIRLPMLAGFMIIGWILVSVTLRVYTNWYDGFLYLIYYDLRFGLLFGIGLGFGIEAGNLLLNPKNTSITTE